MYISYVIYQVLINNPTMVYIFPLYSECKLINTTEHQTETETKSEIVNKTGDSPLIK